MAAQEVDYQQLSKHPRLLLKKGQIETIRQGIKHFPILAKYDNEIQDISDSILDKPPLIYKKQGKRLLFVSREALKRIFYLAYTYRMTKDIRYADCAREVMLTVCAFPDWNPSHFLDVGEMAMAVGIGYDWLYDYLDTTTKTTICQAIVKQAFIPSEDSHVNWFYQSDTNWNSVCNSGLTYAALACHDEIPTWSRKIIRRCLETNPIALNCFKPDGGYPEGYDYWGYGVAFEVMLISAFQTSFNTDFGLAVNSSFLQSARFIEFMTTPADYAFAFSDCRWSSITFPMMFWMASQRDDPSLLWITLQHLNNPHVELSEPRLMPTLLIYAAQLGRLEVTKPKEHYWSNEGETPVYIYRSDWESSQATYLGIKGGSASHSHAHMDAGSFIYEKYGIRWSIDLGMEEYYPLEKQGINLWDSHQESQRWDVFRLSNQAHSTLTINGHKHLVSGYAAITQIYETPEKRGAAIDLSSTLARDLKTAHREIFLDNHEILHVIDSVTTTSHPAVISWIMQTAVEAKITGEQSLLLWKGNHQMTLQVSSPYPVTMRKISNDPVHCYDTPNPGTQRVGFDVTIPADKQVTIEVTIKEFNHREIRSTYRFPAI